MQFKTPKLAVFTNQFGHYDVYLNNDLYEMNDNPLPNGINMFIDSDVSVPDSNNNYISLTDYPEGLKRNITRRIEQYRANND